MKVAVRRVGASVRSQRLLALFLVGRAFDLRATFGGGKG